MRMNAVPAVDQLGEQNPSSGNDWKLLSAELQLSMAEQLDQYAQFLEMGDEAAAESFLRSHPGLQQSMRAHVDDLKLLCRIRRDNEVDVDGEPGQRLEAAEPALERGEVFGNHQTLGDYQIRREIGRGGMGIVYEATQLSLRRNVALKTLPFAAVLDQQQVARFRNEAQAAASLHHPHIVPVFAVGCERGVHYFSMQLINGQTLEQTLSELTSKARSQKISERLSEMRLQNAQQSVGNTTTIPGAGAGLEPAPPSGGTNRSAPPWSAASETVAPVSTKVNARATASTIESVRDRTSIRQLVELIIRVADALEYAHQQGVIHRDIKPSNLLIDEAGKIWVADFGLARCRALGNLTAENKVMGTVRYMSPEQVAGRTHEIDHRTDIYSLGITLYEMLTLQPAFSENNRDRLMRAVEVDAPVSARRLNPSIAVDLETIILKAIAKCKQDRYATAGEFKEDLQRFLDGHAPLAKRPTAMDLGFKWAMRRRRLMLASVSALLLVIAGLATSNAVIAKHSAAKDQANEQARFHLNQAHAAVDRFGGLMADRLSEVEGGELLRSELLHEAQRYYTDFIRYAPADSRYQRELAKIHFQLGAVQSRLGASKLAEESYQQSISMFEELAKDQPNATELLIEQASCLHNLASLRKDQGRYAEAKLNYQEALAQLEELVSKPNPAADLVSQWAATQCNFAILLLECGDAESAATSLAAAVQKLEAVLALNPEDRRARQQLAECRSALVGALLDSDADRSEELLTQTIADLQSLMTTPAAAKRMAASSSLSVPCQLAVAKNNLATLRGKQNRTDDAIQNVREAIQALQQAVEQRPADLPVRQHLAIAQSNLGQLRWSQDKVAEATAAFRLAEANFRHVVAADSSHPQALSRLAGVLHNQSVLQVDSGQWEQAVQGLTEAMDFQATAVKLAPFNAGYRQSLELHRELLDRVLKHLRQRSMLPGSVLDSSLTSHVGDRRSDRKP